MTNDKNAKERILDASIELFSEHGFDGAGIRKIAQKADVNLSMVNYYFKSKDGILVELSDLFFDEIERRMKEENLVSLEIEERFYKVFEVLTKYLKQNHKLFKVIVFTNSASKIEFNKIKASRLRRIITMLYGEENINKYVIDGSSEFHLNMIGPGIVGLAFSHFLLKDLILTLTSNNFDDKFYEEYPKVMAKLLLHGVKDEFDKFL